MKIIEPSAQLIKEDNPFKLVERVGRTCYKSEAKISEDSCYRFVGNLMKHRHYAMLEHANLLFEIQGISTMFSDILNLPYVRYTSKCSESSKTPLHYVTVSMSHIAKWAAGLIQLTANSDIIFRGFNSLYREKYMYESDVGSEFVECLTDRSIIRIKLLNSVDEIIDVDEIDKDTHQFYTIKFTCDRGVSHEFARHRCAVAQESTRYCNYSQSDILFIEPADYENWSQRAKDTFMYACQTSEDCYKRMLDEYGFTPQIARAVLPNALKTEIILTMPRWQWKHFFNLRYMGVTGAPHPDAKRVAGMAYELLKPNIEFKF